MGSVIEDLMKRVEGANDPPKKENERSYKVNDARLADKHVKYCKKCDKCWEIDWQTSRNQRRTIGKQMLISHYSDFPTYGKIKETCYYCLEE